MSEACIFCNSAITPPSIEHIIPASLGNVHYVLARGSVCRQCNQKFGKFENAVLSSREFQKYRNQQLEDKVHDLRRSDLTRFLLKMGYESLYHSKRRIWSKYDFTFLKETLVIGKNHNWEILWAPNHHQYKPIPGWLDRLRLSTIRIDLRYKTSVDTGQLHFLFRFDTFSAAIDLVNPQSGLMSR